jgi:D-alanyl-D-alanine carboxypeptidase/D-alanyl-D-alanine-endopeptidase (penicillin-binding protein 4)
VSAARAGGAACARGATRAAGVRVSVQRPRAAWGAVLAVAAWGCAAGAGAPGPGPAAPLGALRAEMADLFADPAFAHARWGVLVQSAETGEILYRQDAERLFMPASNQKLVTAAVALARLGPGYRFATRVAARGTVRADGTLDGDLVVVGSGDPAISARFAGGDALAVFRAWADSLRARGITRIAGRVVGDDDRFDDVHLGPGWAWDDLGAAYAAEVGALLFDEGAVRFRIAPGDSVGAPARVEMRPPTRYVEVRADVRTVADSTDVPLRAERDPFANRVWLAGGIWIGADSVVRSVAVHDPTAFFVTVLVETLEASGIPVDSGPADRDALGAAAPRREELRTLFVHGSPTLAEIVRPFLKESQNAVGEMLLRAVGAAATDTGSVETGRRVVVETLSRWGIPPAYYVIADGSGLSRYNFLSPEAIVRLLRVMTRRPEFGAFYDALPIAGVDGTLANRMRGTRAEGNARAKTGYISNVRALSGYVTSADGERLVFSFLANNFDAPVPAAEYLQDLAVERLAHFSRTARGPARAVAN